MTRKNEPKPRGSRPSTQPPEQVDLFSSLKLSAPPSPADQPSPTSPISTEVFEAQNIKISAEDQEILRELQHEGLLKPITPKILSVSDLANDLRETLRGVYGEILVQGEICDFKGIHRSGHLYFALKDQNAQIRAVMWKAAVNRVPFDIKPGIEVVCTAKLDFYPGSGSLQIVIEKMEPLGIGALQLKFEQLKEKLKNEGLFDSDKKRPIPPLNWRIGIVTSKTTAALQDMLRIYRSRFPLAEIFLFHAAVQGEQAPLEVSRAIERANRFSVKSAKPINVLIITRGGGSYEDLFCFNDEKIVRAIAASKIPTVSAVGHEIDTTLADYAADKRSATPSHAAQETVPEAALWLDRLSELERVFTRKLDQKISDQKQRLDQMYSRLLGLAPQKRIEFERALLKQRYDLIQKIIARKLEHRKSDINRLSSVLDALSPLKVMDRGYTIACKESDGHAIRSIKDVSKGDALRILLKDGQIQARVEG